MSDRFSIKESSREKREMIVSCCRTGILPIKFYRSVSHTITSLKCLVHTWFGTSSSRDPGRFGVNFRFAGRILETKDPCGLCASWTLKVIGYGCSGSGTSSIDTSVFPCSRLNGIRGCDDFLVSVLFSVSKTFGWVLILFLHQETNIWYVDMSLRKKYTSRWAYGTPFSVGMCQCGKTNEKKIYCKL